MLQGADEDMEETTEKTVLHEKTPPVGKCKDMYTATAFEDYNLQLY